MPRTTKPPSYRLYKRTGQAVVSIDGTDSYLGRYGTKASHAEYDRLVAEWLANGRRLPADDGRIQTLTVLELIARYWKHAVKYYIKDGRPTSESACIKQATRPLKQLYSRINVSSFGPMKLKTVRQAYINGGLRRSTVNKHVARIKRMFRWGVENEMVAPDILNALQAVPGLRRGRSDATEGDPVRPVRDEFVDAVQPFLSRQVWAMIELQRVTGMRSGEVVIMRGSDLDMAGNIWLYRPERHKTEHHGYERVVELGPRAQRVLQPFLKTDLGAHLFSPADAENERRATIHAARKTPLSCGNRPGTNRKRKPKKTPADRYTPDSYRRAITRGCDEADTQAKQMQKRSLDSERIIPRWHPHQLRHNYATRVRKEYGIETARILLGHRSAVVTEIYAEVDRTKAREIVAKIG